MTAELIDRLKAVPGIDTVYDRNGALWADGALLDVEAMAAAMDTLGIRLVTITATPLAPVGETAVIYHYVDERTVISVRTRTRNGALPSLAPKVRAASWAEREITDLFDVSFAGHPNPVPLLRPDGFAPGMLRDAMCAPRESALSPTSPLARR